MMDDLNTLAGRVEAASGPDRRLDAEIATLLRPGLSRKWCWAHTFPKWEPSRKAGLVRVIDNGSELGDCFVGSFTATKYTSSIDAALTLVPDGWAIEISVDFVGGARATLFPQGNAYYGQVKALAATAALALCVAALRASAGAKP